MAIFRPQPTTVLAPSIRGNGNGNGGVSGNDNGFVFRRGRNATALPSKAARLLAAAAAAATATAAKTQAMPAADTAPGGHNENRRPPVNTAVAATPVAARKRQLAAAPAGGSRLDFPEPKRRLTQRASEGPAAAAAADISVPVQRPPQPTPLKPRTRTPMLAGSAAAASAAAGGGAAARRPNGRRKSTLGGRRRSTFSMRGKRASSIGGGFKAVPHESVGSGDFFRHVSPELPEPVRLRQLLAWCARRTTPPASDDTSEAAAAACWPAGLPGSVQRLLGDALREAMDDMHSAFEKEAIVTSWYHRPLGASETEQGGDGGAEQPLRAHPENEANARARDALRARIAALRGEELAWVAEQKRASMAHARCLDRLPRQVRDLAGPPDEGRLAPELAPVARGDEDIDWQAALAPAAAAAAADAGLLAYAAARSSVDDEIHAAERDVARALDDLHVMLDAFHLDVHRAGRRHVAAAEAAQSVAADLGFALAQRRARAAVPSRTPDAATPTLLPMPAKHQPAGHDAARDLLRTLAAATARRS
ncbi:hypothetical protein LPJ53_000854 [Coemansia erecta]|uniref:Uncharacterized protein n=1 Tax=Coemansia erecta TaxID=147472 RepID=A0A9W7Y6M8_9FUNG|nr:hypothetical protein LPJ53_000854 [Coemansia erecta]